MDPPDESNPTSRAASDISPPALDPAKREIRLLQAKKQIQDGKESLLTRMVKVSLLDPTHLPYKTLSYVWFDHTPVYDPALIGKGIQLANKSGTHAEPRTPIDHLQESALAALWQVADTEAILTIWIDAICINQQDSEERGSQVAMMSEIYREADEVIAWLGPDSQTYGVGFHVLDRLAAFGNAHFEERWFQWCYRSNVPAEERRADQYYDGPDGEKIPAWDKVLDAARASLDEWFEPDGADGRPEPRVRDYIVMGLATFWTRAWIFQELAFGRKVRVQSGAASTTLANFIRAAKTWHVLQAAAEYHAIFGGGKGSSRTSHWNPGEFMTTPFDRRILNTNPYWSMMVTLVKVREHDSPAVPAPTLPLKLLVSFSSFNATDARDKIFALWGFVADDGPNAELLCPNYHLSTEEVYTRAARYMVSTHRELTVLTTHSHGDSAYEGFLRLQFEKLSVDKVVLDLPSWVPDWRSSLTNNKSSQSHVWLDERHQGTQPTFTDEEFKSLVRFSEDSRVLKLRGMKIGEICAVYDGNIFPYPVKADGNEDDGPAPSFEDQFVNFVRLAAHGTDILSQYFRFVFRSSEGTQNSLFDYETDLSEPIHTMKFKQDGTILVDEEGVIGSRILQFLVRLIGENDLFGIGASGGPAEETMLRDGRTIEQVIEAATKDNSSAEKHSNITLSKWWDALMIAFDTQTWSPSLKERMKAATHGAHSSEDGREASMKEIQAWIGTKRFNFFIVPGFGLGVCPSCIKPEKGDVVFRPAAHDGPIVLRPIGNGTYKNVGECFVSHSLARAMDDEETMRSMRRMMKWVEIV